MHHDNCKLHPCRSLITTILLHLEVNHDMSSPYRNSAPNEVIQRSSSQGTQETESRLLVSSVVDGVGDGLLDTLGQGLLQGLGHHALTGRVGDLAGLFVAASVVDGVGELVLEAGRCLLLDGLGDGGAALGVGDALAGLVLGHVGGGGVGWFEVFGGFEVWYLELEVDLRWIDGADGGARGMG